MYDALRILLPQTPWRGRIGLNNITSIFGYDQRLHCRRALEIFSTTQSATCAVSPGPFERQRRGIGVASRVAYNRALSYAANTSSKTFDTSFVRYPFKSSVFRGLLSQSASLAEAAPMAGVVTAEGQALYDEVQSMKQRACQ
jgi:hypothetical protein